MLNHGSQWLANELFLKQEMKKVRLIGELPLDEGDRDYLARNIRELVEAQGEGEATKRLESRHAASFAAFLVVQGMLGPQDGDYWADLRQLVPITKDTPQQWGALFCRVLQRLGLPTFEEVGGASQLAPILAHAGIPDASLAAFFEKVLAPSLAAPRCSALGAQDLLDLWRTRSEKALGSPMMPFLLHGGSFAEDFVARSLTMARDGMHAGRRAACSEYGLPERVVERFHRWLDEPGQSQAQGGPVELLHRPLLKMDPFGDGPCLELPAQDLSGRHLQAAWVATTPDGTATVPVPVDPGDDQTHLESTTMPLPHPCDIVTVTLTVDGESRRSWDIRPWSASSCVLLFDPRSGRHLATPPAQCREGLWVLHPTCVQLRWEDGRACTWRQEFDLLPAWCDYHCGRLECDQPGVLLALESGSASPTRLDLRPGASNQFSLQGGRILPTELSTDLPTWIGPPPDLFLPDDAMGNLCIHPEGAALPGDARVLPLAALPVERTPRGRRLSLRHPLLLGPQPVGTFHLTLRGQLGRDARCSLRVIPELAIRHQGPAESLLALLELPRAVNVAHRGAAGLATLERRPDHAIVIPFAAGHAESELQLEWPLPTGGPALIPLRASRRLWRWRLIGSRHGEAGWHETRIEGAVEELLDAPDPTFVVDLSPMGDASLEVTLEFLDANGGAITSPLRVFTGTSEDAAIPLPARARFSLTAVRDTLRSARPSVQGVLRVRRLGVTGSPELVLDATVLALHQSWSIESMRAEAHREETGAWDLHVSWKSPRKVRNRRVDLWALSRPEEGPQTYRIPDLVDQEYCFALDDDSLQPGHYLVELRMHEPWAATPRTRPASSAPNTALLQVGSSDEVQQHLDAIPTSDISCVEKYLAAMVDDGKGGVHTLFPLLEGIRAEDVPRLVDVLLTIADTPSRETEGLDFTRKFLVSEHAATLVSCVARKALGARPSLLAHLVDECVRFDLPFLAGFRAQQEVVPTEVRQALWRLWAPMAAFLVPHGWDTARPEFAHHLGHEAMQRIEEWSAGTWDLLGAVDRQEIPLVAAVVEACAGACPPPRERLGDGAFNHACLAWLRRALEDGGQQSATWAKEAHPRLRAWIAAAQERKWVDEELAQELEKRLPAAHHSRHNLVPYCVGALALLQLTLAGNEARRAELHLQEKDLHDDLVQAHGIAPELLAHDLCLVEVCLRIRGAYARPEAASA